MLLRIETASEKKLVGKRMNMTFADNRTGELWGSFMPHRREIISPVSSDLYSVEVYAQHFFDSFDPQAMFEKWAAVEVADFHSIPDGMEILTIPGGLYAIFLHKGPASEGPTTYNYIFGTWLPTVDYMLDNRPHFALMGAKYKREDPDSEEEIWIPIKPKEIAADH